MPSPNCHDGNKLCRRGAAKTVAASPKKSKPAATKRAASPVKEPSSSPAKKAKKTDKAAAPSASPAAPTRDVMQCYCDIKRQSRFWSRNRILCF